MIKEFTEKEKTVALLMLRDYTPEMIAEEMATSRNNVYRFMEKIRIRMDTLTTVGGIARAIVTGRLQLPRVDEFVTVESYIDRKPADRL